MKQIHKLGWIALADEVLNERCNIFRQRQRIGEEDHGSDGVMPPDTLRNLDSPDSSHKVLVEENQIHRVLRQVHAVEAYQGR